jgi:nucleoside-diphosphate-sugar epimerase
LKRTYAAKDGDSLEVFSVDHRRTFCFIEDAVTQLELAATSERCLGETVNLGTETPEVTIGELAQKVLDTVGRKLTIVPKPATAGSPARRCPDMKKTAELTGYRSRVSLEEGLARTFAWYRANVFDGSAISAI